MIILSPRAIKRLKQHRPAWPVPKLFRIAHDGQINEGLFNGETINTPSLLVVEDYLDALRWAASIGGIDALAARADASADAVATWVDKTPWIDFLAKDPATRANTGVCLIFSDECFAKSETARANLATKMIAMIEKEGAGYDFGAYRFAPPGFRIWCGSTVETSDVQAFLPWLDWAYCHISMTSGS